jgi:hypothetical protein
MRGKKLSIFAILFFALFCIHPVHADDDAATKDAQDKLQARLAAEQVQREAEAVAATQPSNLTNGDVAQIKEAFRQLVAENTKLRAMVAGLQQQIQGNQNAANAGPNFFGAQEARVGMTMADLQGLPNAKVELLGENTNGATYRVSTGQIIDYGQRTVQDFPSNQNHGGIYHNDVIQVGSHFSKKQQVMVDSASGRVVEVEVIPEP